jgi:hypothetical protein
MKNLLILLFCLLTYIGYAQADASASNVAGIGIGNSTMAMSSVVTTSIRSIKPDAIRPSFANITGSAYLQDMFIPTKLYYGNEFMKNIYYRYNAYNEEIEVKQSPGMNKGEIGALNKDKKISILVDNDKMGFKTFVTAEKKTLNGYLIALLNDKDYDLYKRIHIIYSPGRVSTNSFVKAVPNRFTKFTEYYFQKEGVNRIDEIPPNNRQFLKLLDGTTKGDMKTFLKDNKLNVKDEADLIEVFKYLNK